MKRVVCALFAVALTLGVGTASGRADPGLSNNQMVVIKATGATLQEGQIIDGGAPLKLEAGAEVVLIGADGATVTLSGPYNGEPAAARGDRVRSPNIVKALGALLSSRKYSTASLGVVRSADAGEMRLTSLPSPWVVDIEASGPRCVRSDIVVLWRDDAAAASTLTISRGGAALTAQADWAAGDNVLPLTSDRFRNGGRYSLDVDGRRIAVTFHMLPDGLTEIGQQAAWMAESGCKEQALALLDTL